MSGRPRLLDIFCCAGGAGRGYTLAGFDVFGADRDAQPNYPYPFRQASWDDLDAKMIRREFDAVHASPPCQGYTSLRHAPGAVGAPRLIGAVRELLEDIGRPYTLENVEGAAAEMPGAICLCGTMFDLGAHGCELQRHRLFTSNVAISPPGPCQHSGRPVVGIYGDHARIRSGAERHRPQRWPETHRKVMQRALGMAWGTAHELSEAIPPAYTHHLGLQLIRHV